MTTKTHCLRLPAQVTEAIVEFSSEFMIDLNTVETMLSEPLVVIIGEEKCGKQVVISESLYGMKYFKVSLIENGELLETKHVEVL